MFFSCLFVLIHCSTFTFVLRFTHECWKLHSSWCSFWLAVASSWLFFFLCCSVFLAMVLYILWHIFSKWLCAFLKKSVCKFLLYFFLSVSLDFLLAGKCNAQNDKFYYFACHMQKCISWTKATITKMCDAYIRLT